MSTKKAGQKKGIKEKTLKDLEPKKVEKVKGGSLRRSAPKPLEPGNG